MLTSANSNSKSGKREVKSPSAVSIGATRGASASSHSNVVQERLSSNLIIKASNYDPFPSWLTRNLLTAQILNTKLVYEVTDIMIGFMNQIQAAGALSEHDLQLSHEIMSDVMSYKYWRIHELLELPAVAARINPIAKELIINHIYELPVVDESQEDVLAKVEKKYNELILTHGIPSSLSDRHVLAYNYTDYKSPIDREEHEAFLDQFNAYISKLNRPLDTLLFSGGHGSKILLNNLPRNALQDMVDILKRNKISVDLIVIDCCYSAYHLDILGGCLSNQGVILCNYLESTHNTFLDALNQDRHREHNITQTITNALQYNCGIGIYAHSRKELYIQNPATQVSMTPQYEGFKIKRDIARSTAVLREKAAQLSKSLNTNVKLVHLSAHEISRKVNEVFSEKIHHTEIPDEKISRRIKGASSLTMGK